MKCLKLMAAATVLALGCSLASAGITRMDFQGTCSFKGVADFAGTASHDYAGGMFLSTNTSPSSTGNKINNKTPPTDVNSNGPTAVPLPPAIYVGLMMLAILGAVAARKRLAAMFA